jgi:hypothetical protein
VNTRLADINRVLNEDALVFGDGEVLFNKWLDFGPSRIGKIRFVARSTFACPFDLFEGQ